MSVNTDKALQVRPPIAIYVLEPSSGIPSQTFEIPGVPNYITGAPPLGAHTMITNFISIQADEELNPPTPGPPAGNGDPIYIAFGPSNVTADPNNTSAGGGFGANPEPAGRGCIRVNQGETVRFDMSDLYQKGVGEKLVPIEFMAVYTDNPNARVRVWRSSGR